MLRLMEELVSKPSVAYQTHDGKILYKKEGKPIYTWLFLNTSPSDKHNPSNISSTHLCQYKVNIYLGSNIFLTAYRYHIRTSAHILSNHAVLKESHSCPCTPQPSIHFRTGSSTRRRQRQQCSRCARLSSCLATPARCHARQA